jgi:DNA-binding IscR family transcriptional regulator
MEDNANPDVVKNRPLERIFRNNIARIIDFLIINQQFKFTSKEISKLSDTPLRSVQRILPQLVKNKIIIENKYKGKIKNYEVNRDFKLVEILSLYSIETVNMFVDEALETRKENTLVINSKLLESQ